jgi:hypothetical protein
MCMSASAPPPPAPPPAAPNFDAVKSVRADERRRLLAARGGQDTILTGPGGLDTKYASTGKTMLGA